MVEAKTTDLTFGQKLKALRDSRAFTQRQVGQAIHVHPSLICLWETDKASPQMRHVEKLAKLFGVSLAYWD